MHKKIAVAGVVIALIGLYAEFALSDPFSGDMFSHYLRSFFSSLNLGFLDGNRFYRPDDFNYINVFFYSLLLSGGIISLISKKETRLIRYVFSMILLSRAVMVISIIFSLPFSYKWVIMSFNWAIMLGYMVWHLLWIWLCWSILKYYKNTREIAVIKKQYGEVEQDIISEASRWQRFFNFIADFLTFVFIFMPILESLIRSDIAVSILQPLEEMAGERFALYTVCAVFQFIYYSAFEGFLQASPGKLLTETRVVSDSGQKPAMRSIFLRTIVRFVPFEAFSMLFGRGWHDNWSDTYVVKEKREGVAGGWYFFIFPAFILLGIGAFFGYHTYREYQSEKYFRDKFEKKVESLTNALDHLTTSHVITIKTNSGGLAYLKVEKVAPESITFAIIELRSRYDASQNKQMEMERTFTGEKDGLATVRLTRKELLEGILKEYAEANNYGGYAHGTADLLKNGNRCSITEIEEWFAPNITLDHIEARQASTDLKTFSIYLKNKGWKAELSKIDDKGANYEWSPPLPAAITASQYGQGLTLYTTVEDIDNFEADVTFKDSLNRIQVFTITGSGPNFRDAEMKRIK